MIIQRLKLSNFKQYGSLDLIFKDGLIGIVGKNGSGKSTLFQAILLCLFGTTKNVKKDQLRSSWVTDKEGVELELYLSVAGKDYRIHRTFRGKKLTTKAAIYNTMDEMLANSTREVNEFVTDLIGMDRDAFSRSIFSGQKELAILSNAIGSERKKIVRKMIGLDNLDLILKEVRVDRNNLNNQIKGQEKMLLSSVQEEELKTQKKEWKVGMNSVEKELLALKEKSQEAMDEYLKAKSEHQHQQIAFEDFSRLDKKLGECNQLMGSLKNQIQEKEEELKILEVLKKAHLQKTDLVRHFKELEDKIQKAENIKEQLVAKKSILERMEYAQIEINNLNTKLQSFDSQEVKLENLYQEIKELQQQSEDVEAQLEENKKIIKQQVLEVGAIKGKIDNRQKEVAQIRALDEDSHCPTCLQPLHQVEDIIQKLVSEIENYENKNLTQLQEKVQQAEKKSQDFKKRLTHLDFQKKDRQKQILQLQNEAKRKLEIQKEIQLKENYIEQEKSKLTAFEKLSFNENVYQQHKIERDNLKDQYAQYQIDEAKIAEMDKFSTKIQSLNERIEKGTSKIEELKHNITSLNYDKEKHQAAAQRSERLEQHKEAARNAHHTVQKEYNKISREYDRISSILTKNTTDKNKIKHALKDLDQLNQLEGLFNSFNVYILDKIRPTITHYAGELFQQITRGRYEGIEVDENFEFNIYENGSPYPINRFSGGEIDLANLCLRIGMSKAIAELSGSNESLNFLGFDEIFGSQDDDRRMEIMRALEHLKEQYRQIYIITHVESVKDFFPAILHVSQNQEGSTATF